MPRGGSLRENPAISGYVDIHTHLLPGIDDGAPDPEESLAMARAAVESGVATIAATPHLHPDFPDVEVTELRSRCDRLREELRRDQIPLEIVSGAEIALIWALDATDEQLTLASYGQRGTDLLIEAPLAYLAGVEQFVAALSGKGYRITLAHPERSPQFQQDMASLRTLADQGVLLQLNADSLLGSGGTTKRLARELLREGLAHVIASDGHRAQSWRPVTRLAKAVEAAGKLVGAQRSEWMAQAVPAAILSGAELPPAPPASTRPSARRLFRLR